MKLVVFCCPTNIRKFLPPVISLLKEWTIENTAVFSCKTSAFSQKYILNKILSMKLVVFYRYINCTVNKTTGTGTGYTNNIY